MGILELKDEESKQEKPLILYALVVRLFLFAKKKSVFILRI